MIEVKNISKSFGDIKVLTNLTCNISVTGMTVMVGPSGAGKSTLMRCINKLETIDKGSIKVFGIEVPKKRNDLIKFRKDIAMIFQQFNLINQMTVLENVLIGRLNGKGFFPSLFKKFTKVEIKMAEMYLDKVGLYDKRFNKASELSGGQQQRVAIARALIQKPKIILADEPIASLDPKTSTQIMDLLSSIVNEEGIGVLITLHQIDYAKKYADHIIGLNHGKIILDANNSGITLNEVLNLYEMEDVNFNDNE